MLVVQFVLNAAQEIRDLSETLEEMYESQREPKAPPGGSPDKQEKQHLTMELAESKAKIRKLRQQLYVRSYTARW